jgi:L-fuculose-phosphate aldolase
MKQALGIIETRGLVMLVQAVDAMLKAARVEFKGWKQINGGQFTAFISGEAPAVNAALDAAASAIKSIGGGIIRTHMIPQVHDAVERVLHTLETTLPDRGLKPGADAPAPSGLPEEAAGLFYSPEARALKEEICEVGRKLWQRSYVDGNGGNISCRIGENAVMCTPTLLSKADLSPEDLCLVDFEGNQLAGALRRTSEVYLHLEIYKAVPQAKAVVHCHPPHATAYAITGHVPPTPIIPEFEVFAVTPYETPGTKKFAETVLPFVESHNTILLGNHGVVCWADTPTHAEWYAENIETYCWTLLISRQLGVPYIKIPPEKQQDLLKIKKRLGQPDARLKRQERGPSDQIERPGEIALAPPAARNHKQQSIRTLTDADIEAIAEAAADAVIAAIKPK